MKGSYFVFESVDLLYYNLHKTTLRRGKSYIKSPEWLRNKRATINSQNEDDNRCFQYAVTVALNHENIENHPEKISSIKPYIDKYICKDIDIPLQQKDQKKLEQEDLEKLLKIIIIKKLTGKSLNKVIRQLLLISHLIPYNTKTIRFAYKPKYNCKRENKVVLLMITDGKKWHYLAVNFLPALLRGITSNHNGDFYCLNSFHSYRTNNALKKHERLCSNHDYYHVEMPKENEKNIKIQPRRKVIEFPFIIIRKRAILFTRKRAILSK